MILNNYYFFNFENPNEIIVSKKLGGNFEGEFGVFGKSEDNTLVVSGKINSISNGIITTDESEYFTGMISKDYLDFISAVTEKIPVIEKWELDRIPVDTHIKGICEGEEIFKKIISQDGNYLTLDDGKKYFVNWSSMSEITKKRIETSRYATYFKEITNFCDIKCKVIL